MLLAGLGLFVCGSIGCQTPTCSSCSNCAPGQAAAGGHGIVPGVDPGCSPAPLRWQQGGLDYSRNLSYGHYAHQQAQTSYPTAQVAYPYYTVRGPRDFLLDNPPSIGR